MTQTHRPIKFAPQDGSPPTERHRGLFHAVRAIREARQMTRGWSR